MNDIDPTELQEQPADPDQPDPPYVDDSPAEIDPADAGEELDHDAEAAAGTEPEA